MRMNIFKYSMALLYVLLFSVTNNYACECGSPGPACTYISSAQVVFVGTPVYSNDNGSGTFLQQTLYKFTVEEVFKGLPENTREVWVDPGSYTSCYADYPLGKKLLVFASVGKFFPIDTAAMTVAKTAGKVKPLPPGFDPTTQVYYAPECNGTRDADNAVDDIAWLRLWKKGEASTRIQGFVFDSLDWPLPRVKVVAKGDAGSLIAATDVNGAFAFEQVKPGKYEMSASLSGYHLSWRPQVAVEEQTCGYARLAMDSTGGISGTVLENDGKPAVGVELDIARIHAKKEIIPSIPREKTENNGFFRYQDLPAGDYLIGINLNSQPNVDRPYARIYAPGVSDRDRAQVIHLAPGQKVSGIRMQLAPRLRLRTVHVQVLWPDGRNVGPDVSVVTDESETGVIDFENTKDDGTASVQCFVASSCIVEAKKWLTRPGEDAKPQVAASLIRQIEAGDAPVSVTLILSERRDPW
jgi:hypothetical protein